MRQICLDSSVLVKLVLPEEDSHAAEALLSAALGAEVLIVAPDFAWAEVGSAIRRRTRQRLTSVAAGAEAWRAFRALPLSFLPGESLAEAAWAAAERWTLPTLYDAAFLAAGEPGGFWTSDARLLEALGGARPEWVHRLGEALP